MLHDIENSSLYTFNAIGRNQHLQTGLILAAKALGCQLENNLVTGNNADIDNCRSIVLGIYTIENRFFNNRLAEVTVNITLGYAGIDSIFKGATFDMNILSDFGKNDSHTGILADRTILITSNLCILNNLVKDITADGRLLCFPALLQSLVNILREIIGSLFAELCHCFSDCFSLNNAHNEFLLKMIENHWIICMKRSFD